MLVWDPVEEEYRSDLTPSYGKDTLDEFFKTAVNDGMGGQELGDQAVFGVGKWTIFDFFVNVLSWFCPY